VIFFRELFFYPSKNSLFIYTRLFQNLKARILKSIITWSEMGQQTAQAKKVYWVKIKREAMLIRNTFTWQKCVPFSPDLKIALYFKKYY